MKEITIAIIDTPETATYQMVSAMRLNINGKLVETLEELEVDIRYVRIFEGKCVFQLNVKKYSLEGTETNFMKWAAKVNSLLHEITIFTDLKGTIVNIQILQGVEKWYKLENELRKEYKKVKGLEEMLATTHNFFFTRGKIIQQLANNGYHQLFFNSHYGQYHLNETITESRMYPGLVGGIDVPVILQKKVQQEKETKTRCSIHVKGELDLEQFDRKSYVRWAKELANMYNLKPKHLLETEETYHFDDARWLLSAETYLSFTEPGLYELTMARTAKNITQKPVVVNRWVSPTLQ